jgi:TPR repeat protein
MKIKVCEKLFGLPGFGYEAEKILEELLSFVPQQRYYDDLSVGGYEMLRLGDFLASKVTPPKPDLAIKCYENILKINAGWAGFAWFGLAKLYVDGVGVIRNQSEAVNLWVKSAMLGHPGACHELGLAYHLASGVGLDLVEAYAWFNNAHALGFQSSGQKVSEIERQLSPEQITVAQSRSASLNALIQRGIEAERKLLLGG